MARSGRAVGCAVVGKGRTRLTDHLALVFAEVAMMVSRAVGLEMRATGRSVVPGVQNPALRRVLEVGRRVPVLGD